MGAALEYVFGYGSLLGLAADGDGLPPRVCRLRDHRRTWNVAMDNSVELPDYKHYLDADGVRAALFVTFLNLVPAPGFAVNGVLFAVAPAELLELDRRERNYERIDVGERLDVPIDGAAWAYFGGELARARFDGGMRAGAAVVDRTYLDAVRGGFAAIGADALGEFDASTDAPPCPIVPLTRIDPPNPRSTMVV